MRVFTIVGARPQFIKAAPVSRILREEHEELLVHTGQHYDHGMSAVFFEELGIPKPDVNLGIGSGLHGWQTGQMMVKLEELIIDYKPEWVIIYGDTNSTLAGALTTVKLQVPLAHVEAGLRSFNRQMPEEINRVLADRCSQALFCPTPTAIKNLSMEGIRDGVYLTDDVMYDALLMFLSRVDEKSVLASLNLKAGEYVLATIHRASNTDDKASLTSVLTCLAISPCPVVLPLHPRTAVAIQQHGLQMPENVRAIEPVSYLQMVALEKSARLIMTDSGGVQKEAYILGVPCVTLRDETEWVETVQTGWNTVVGLDENAVSMAISKQLPQGKQPKFFGDGTAARRIVDILSSINTK